jgi:hypothetical protein
MLNRRRYDMTDTKIAENLKKAVNKVELLRSLGLTVNVLHDGATGALFDVDVYHPNHYDKNPWRHQTGGVYLSVWLDGNHNSSDNLIDITVGDVIGNLLQEAYEKGMEICGY